jgi:hypothetical protein
MAATAQSAKGALSSSLSTIATITTAKRSLYIELHITNTGSSNRVIDITFDGRYIQKGHATNNYLLPGQTLIVKSRHHMAAAVVIQAKQDAGTDCDYFITVREGVA